MIGFDEGSKAYELPGQHYCKRQHVILPCLFGEPLTEVACLATHERLNAPEALTLLPLNRGLRLEVGTL